MRSEKIVFTNRDGIELAARLDLPPLEVGAGEPLAYAVFAHCFTCSKDFPAAARVSRGLAERGFGVLRFDFTGLGSSDGDFANTNFSSNVADLEDAWKHLKATRGVPTLLVGHSLGGAAVLAAARGLPEVEAVVTIGAPASPAHVVHNFASSRGRIEAEGEAEVSLAGRTFTIKKQFIDDVERLERSGGVGNLDAALLVMHAPLDETVPIDEARKIYTSARGYKSFVTLADADHLLTRKADAEYASDVIAAWASRYVSSRAATERPRPEPGTVVVEEIALPYTNRVTTAEHELVADEPTKVGGADAGPSPFELLYAALGACTTMTLRMYADRKGWPLEHVSVQVRHERVPGPEGPKGPSTEEYERDVRLVGDLDAEQRARLIEIAERCPIHRTLENDAVIRTREVDGVE